ncbi:MAG: hypothetical protein AB7E60_01950 [Sphingobium sp.]
MDQTPPVIRIFRPGTFVSNEGQSLSFSEADLAAAAAAYDRDADPAPLVVGHPAIDAPAYGWVKGLVLKGGELVAEPERIEPAFAEAVRAGRYAKVSARFYPPAHPANPKPGSWYLKHVGFLGGHAPGVKGLGVVQFSEGGDEGALSFDFPLPKETDMDKSALEASFAERESDIARREAELAEREAAQQRAAVQARHAGNVSFAEALVSEVRLAPAGKALLVGVLDHLDAAAVASFGEAGDMTPADALKKLLSSSVPLVDLGERGKAPKGDASYVSFAAPAGYEVDPDQADLYVRATRILQDHPDISWMDAVRRAQAS